MDIAYHLKYTLEVRLVSNSVLDHHPISVLVRSWAVTHFNFLAIGEHI